MSELSTCQFCFLKYCGTSKSTTGTVTTGTTFLHNYFLRGLTERRRWLLWSLVFNMAFLHYNEAEDTVYCQVCIRAISLNRPTLIQQQPFVS